MASLGAELMNEFYAAKKIFQKNPDRRSPDRQASLVMDIAVEFVNGLNHRHLPEDEFLTILLDSLKASRASQSGRGDDGYVKAIQIVEGKQKSL